MNLPEEIYVVLVENKHCDPETTPFYSRNDAIGYAKSIRDEYVAQGDIDLENDWFEENEQNFVNDKWCYIFFVDDCVSIRVTREKIQ